MPPLEIAIAAFMLLSLTVYVLSGGADFGGGVWDLFATGPRERDQREAISKAIAPVWEANHVWLIVVVVLLFAAFPPAFATVMTVLHIPLAIMLIGVVLRGSAFVFRAYDDRSEQVWERWSRVFAAGSVIAPFALGVSIGAVAAGRVRVDPDTGRAVYGFVKPWLSAFPVSIGAFTLALCAFLAAVYLTVEVEDEELREVFREKAIKAATVVGVLALLCFLLTNQGAPQIAEGIGRSWWSLPFQLVTGSAAVAAIWGLWTRNYPVARLAAIAQVTLIVWGWGLSQHPYLVVPDITIQEAAAPEAVLRALALALTLGLIVLVPSFLRLYSIFKAKRR